MRTHNTPRLCAGPQTAGTPIKFWNVASIGDDEGEITLYGDVVSRQPVDWWTGEPEPGLYIAPESFMEDLAAVKGKSNITIKINSCGGDLYTGIAIHNAIKGLTGHKVVVVEGIAASAASVIACAGDEVQVYPGSMVMIHGVAGLLYDYYTLAEAPEGLRRERAGHRRDLPRQDRPRGRPAPQHDDPRDVDGRAGGH